jgi:hypothetical protein
MWRSRGPLRRASLLVLTAALSGCRVDDQILYDKLYTCSGGSGSDICGTGREGNPLSCFAGYQLGARNFCAPTCDPSLPLSDPDSVCLSSGVALARCRPSDGARACPLSELSCLRTDTLSDEGVCMAIPLCQENRDCPDPARSTCLGALLRDFYGEAAGLAVDHLSCLQAGCIAGHADCPSGEACLPSLVPASSNPPDICVPRCDARLNCPPNHLCYRKLSPLAPDVCIPGILGFGCTSDLDCVIGKCVTGDGFSNCSVPCNDAADCVPFSAARGAFACVDPGLGGQKYCINNPSLGGAACRTTSDCKSGEICTDIQPVPSPGVQPHECRKLCATAADCPRLAGVPQSCVEDGFCFAGRLEVSCHGDQDCVPDLQCMPFPPAVGRDGATPRMACSFSCSTDEDCTFKKHPLMDSDGRCVLGVCHRARPATYPCDADFQCASGSCSGAGADGGASGTCL